MPKAEKRGKHWRCRIYDYTDENGKRHYKSFTADTKKGAEFKAAEWLTTYKKTQVSITFKEAREGYINNKKNVLSPTTVRNYNQISKYYGELDGMNIADINQRVVQKFVNGLSKDLAPKTVCNIYGFITAVMGMYSPEVVIRVKLPQRKLPTYHLPTMDDLKKVIEYLEKNDTELLIAVYLSAFGTLRRSEICALTADDVTGCKIHINKAMVLDENMQWVIKTTKTVSSDRYVTYPQFIIDKLPKEGRLCNLKPCTITNRFIDMFKKIDVQKFRFHDLRHYAASFMHALGIPDQYIMLIGGWQSDTVLKKVYRGTLEDYQEDFEKLRLEALDAYNDKKD